MEANGKLQTQDYTPKESAHSTLSVSTYLLKLNQIPWPESAS
jgi:hypothetical protein